MAETRREFSLEFKREAVALLEGRERPLTRVASEVGISPSMSRNWRALARDAMGAKSDDVDALATAVAIGSGIGIHAVDARPHAR
jgi:transposase-like protein